MKSSELVISAVRHLTDKRGSSPKDILKFISRKFGVDPKRIEHHVYAAIERGLQTGALIQQDGLFSWARSKEKPDTKNKNKKEKERDKENKTKKAEKQPQPAKQKSSKEVEKSREPMQKSTKGKSAKNVGRNYGKRAAACKRKPRKLVRRRKLAPARRKPKLIKANSKRSQGKKKKQEKTRMRRKIKRSSD